MPFDIKAIRAEFPSLKLSDDGMPRICLDSSAAEVERLLARLQEPG